MSSSALKPLAEGEGQSLWDAIQFLLDFAQAHASSPTGMRQANVQKLNNSYVINVFTAPSDLAMV